jgi:hypothetical protein
MDTARLPYLAALADRRVRALAQQRWPRWLATPALRNCVPT